MAFNIHITQIHENPIASQLSPRGNNSKHKRAATITTPIFTPTLFSVPTEKVINKYPVRIFNIES